MFFQDVKPGEKSRKIFFCRYKSLEEKIVIYFNNKCGYIFLSSTRHGTLGRCNETNWRVTDVLKIAEVSSRNGPTAIEKSSNKASREPIDNQPSLFRQTSQRDTSF
ncbi:hypothetical protein AVEN_46677-1 [Araneus ventricosus]|uniref:Uncharacterized protein n=1 Tax=Araneus ventricosus TaxID=182803 RepID=A0A4Y2V4N2_ARAVE|nr:hypothetical protein AVEN_46677-1 [Araneus ventricosus]